MGFEPQIRKAVKEVKDGMLAGDVLGGQTTSSKASAKQRNGVRICKEKCDKDGTQRILPREQKSPSQAETANGTVGTRFIHLCASLDFNLGCAIFLAMYPIFLGVKKMQLANEKNILICVSVYSLYYIQYVYTYIYIHIYIYTYAAVMILAI